MEWDDLRYVLAVSRTGSALGAARELGVNQSTVVRRLTQIEASSGADLFDRKQRGDRVTSLGQAMVETAKRIEAEVQLLENHITTAGRTVSGVVRFTTTETIANIFAGGWFRDFQKRCPDVRVELFTDDRRTDVAGGEADVALRAGSRPEGAGIVARKLVDIGWTVYCSEGYAAEHGMPKKREEIVKHAIIGMEGPMAQLSGPKWLLDAHPCTPRFSSNSLSNLMFSLKAGLGVAVLPCLSGGNTPGLVRCMPPPPELNHELWLIVRDDLKSTPAVRSFADFVTEQVLENRSQWTGVDE